MRLDEPYWQHERGRWMCGTDADAMHIVEEHPGDAVWVYDRADDGRQINIRPYWTPDMPEDPKEKLPQVRKGNIRR